MPPAPSPVRAGARIADARRSSGRSGLRQLARYLPTGVANIQHLRLSPTSAQRLPLNDRQKMRRKFLLTGASVLALASSALAALTGRKMTMGKEPRFSAAETTWLLERRFEIDENGGSARISGEMTLDLVKDIKDTAMIYVLLPDDTVVGGRVLDLSHIIATAHYLRK